MPVKSAYTQKHTISTHTCIHTHIANLYTYIKRYLKENANTNVYPIMKKKRMIAPCKMLYNLQYHAYYNICPVC